jgi:hypothetical protein
MDFKKYKRFFAFGCSLTEYAWPTWADIIAKEIPESYNYGKSGAGNVFIASQISEAYHRHRFNQDDLIMCMWSGFTREDRYVKHTWKTPGNIFTQNFYDSSFIEKYADIRGYLLRDMSLISLTLGFLENLKVDHYMLNMMSFRYTQSDTFYNFKENDDILELFDTSLRKIKPDFATIELDNNWPAREIYHNANQKVDYHPSTKQHLQYLQKVFPDLQLSKETIEFVEYYENMISNAKRINDIDWKIIRPKRF